MLDGDEPVAGAHVRLRGAAGEALSDSADAAGRASFPHLPAGPVTIEVRRLGLVPVRRTIELKPGCRAHAVARLASYRCDIAPRCAQPESELAVSPCRPDV